MIEEVKQVLFEYLLTNKEDLLLDYFRRNPLHLNEAMNESGHTILDLALLNEKRSLHGQLRQMLTGHESNTGYDSVDLDDSNQPLENSDMFRRMHSIYNAVINPQDRSSSQYGMRLNNDANKLKTVVENFQAAQLSRVQKKDRPSETRKKIYQTLEKLIIGRLSAKELVADAVLDYMLTVKCLVQIYRATPDAQLDTNLQDFFNLRDKHIRGTRLDYCYADSLVNTSLTELAGDKPYDVLMQNSLHTLADTNGHVEVYKDIVTGVPVSLSNNTRDFVRDQEGYIHSVHYYDADYEFYRGVFAKGIEKLCADNVSDKTAIRQTDELWFSEDARVEQTKPLPLAIQNWLINSYQSFKQMHDYVKQFEAYDKANEAKMQFYALIKGLYDGGKKQGSGTEEFAGEESTIAVALFTDWLNVFKKDCPNQYNKIMSAKAYISNGKGGALEKQELKSLEEVLFPILYPAEALKKDKNLLCSDQNGSNLKAFLEKPQIQSLFNGLNTLAQEPVKRSKQSLSSQHTLMQNELKTKNRLELDQQVLPMAYGGIAIDAIQQLAGMTMDEFHFIMSVLSQPGLSKVKSDFLSGKDRDSWTYAQKVYKSESVFFKHQLSYRQLQTYLMATYLREPHARLEPTLVNCSIQQAMDEKTNETPWILQLVKISRQVDGRFKFSDERFAALQVGEYLVHNSGSHKTQYKLVDRVRKISKDTSHCSGQHIIAREVESEATDSLRLRPPCNLKPRKTDRLDGRGEYIYDFPVSYDDEVIEDEIEVINDRYWWNERATAWQRKCIRSCKNCSTCRQVVSDREHNGEWRDLYGSLIARKVKHTKKHYKDDIFLNLQQHWRELSIGKEGGIERPLQADTIRHASLMDYAIVTTNVSLFSKLVELDAPIKLQKLFSPKNQVMSRFMMQQIIKVLAKNKVKNLALQDLRQLFSECRRLNQPLLLADIIKLGLPVNDKFVNLRKNPSTSVSSFLRSYTSILDFALQTHNESLITACIDSNEMSIGSVANSISQLCGLYRSHYQLRTSHTEIIAKKIAEGLLMTSSYVSNQVFYGIPELSDAVLGELTKQASKHQLETFRHGLIESSMLQSLLCNKLNNVMAFFEKTQSVKPMLLRLLSSNQLSNSHCSLLLKKVFSDPLLKDELLSMLSFSSLGSHNIYNKEVVIKVLSAISEFSKIEVNALSDKQVYAFLKQGMATNNKTLQLNLEKALSDKVGSLEKASKELLLLEAIKKGYIQSVNTYFKCGARLTNFSDIQLATPACQSAVVNYMSLLALTQEKLSDKVLFPLAQKAFAMNDDVLLSKLLDCGLSATHQFQSPSLRSMSLIDLAINNQKQEFLAKVTCQLEQVRNHKVVEQDKKYIPKLRGPMLQAYLKGVAQGSMSKRKVNPDALQPAMLDAISTNATSDIDFLIKQGANASACISHLTLKNAHLLPFLIKSDQKISDELSRKFVAMYDAMYRTNAFINVCPFSFFRSANQWQDKKPSLLEIINYCKDKPNSRSAKVFETLLKHNQMLTSVEEVQDKTDLFKDLHKLSYNSSIFSSTCTDDTVMKNEKNISDYVQQHQGSRSDVIAQAIGIK